MPLYLVAFLIGLVAGLRTFTAPAAVSWAARLGWMSVQGTPLAVMGAAAMTWIFTLAAVFEIVVFDKLPKAGSRKSPPQFHRPNPVGSALWRRRRRLVRSARRWARPWRDRRRRGNAWRLRVPVAPRAGRRKRPADRDSRRLDRGRSRVFRRQPAALRAALQPASASRLTIWAGAERRAGAGKQESQQDQRPSRERRDCNARRLTEEPERSKVSGKTRA